GSVSLVGLEYRWDPDSLLVALGHWLVYLQLVKMFLTKTIEDYWFLFVLALTQVLVAGVINQSDQVGTVLLAWVLLSLWVLGLFSLHRDALRARQSIGTAVGHAPVDAEPYPGLFTFSFVFASLRVMATTVALGGIIFLAMPRKQAGTRTVG